MAMLGNNLDSVRRENLSMVLGIVHRRGRVSRSQITHATGLNRSTVAALVAELVALDLVVVREPDASVTTVGRPSPQISPADTHVTIAVNPELDAVTVGVVGLAGTVVHRLRRDVDHALSPAEATAIIADIVAELERGVLVGRTVVAVGVAVPGLVRSSDGVVRWAPHLEWFDQPLAELVATATGYRVAIGNDASLGALAEHLFGVGRDATDMIYLNGGASGIGGGVIASGRPLGGVGGYAGEFGQNRLGIDIGTDRTSPDGTLEDEVSRARLLDVVGLSSADGLRLEQALADASENPAVRAEVSRQLRILSVALSNAINVLNPQTVVLGGFLAALYAFDPVTLEDCVAQQAVPAAFEGVRIVPAALGEDLLMIGAAQLAFEDLLRDPASAAASAATQPTPSATDGENSQ
ncbi:MAG: transcriptional regulator [Microbacteriaceae bacterium]|nr:transcriptional regulator [Microbacteriaceae bacterium]